MKKFQKIKRHFFIFLTTFLGILSLVAGCGNENAEKLKELTFSHPKDLDHEGMLIGVPQGAASMIAAERYFKHATIKYYNSSADGYTALQQKKINAFVFDRHNIDYAVKVNSAFAQLPTDIAEEHIVVGIFKKEKDLLKEVNRFIAKYRADGTYQDMYQRWFSGNLNVMPDISPPKKPTRKLKIATEGLNVPMNFFGNDGVLTGFDVELIKRLALSLNADVQLTTMSFDGLIPAIQSGKIDMLIASLNVTEERKETMLMSDDYLDTSICVMIHKDCLSDEVKKNKTITTIKDLSGKRVASLTGSIFQQAAEALVDNVDHVTYNDNNSSLQAVRLGKADALLCDEPVAKLFVARFPKELRIASIFAKDSYGFAFRKGSALRAKANKVIKELKRTGELDRLIAKWCGADDSKKILEKWSHKKDFTGKNGTLKFAADSVMEPMCYVGHNGQGIGLDVDVMARIAYDLDMKFEFIPMSFGALIEALIAEKADVVGGSMSITEERKQKVDFTDCYYVGGMTILTRKTPDKKAGKTDQEITEISQLYGKRIGILTGTTMDRIAQDYLPSSESIFFNAFADLPIALKSGKIEGFLIEEPQARILAKQQPDLRILSKKLSSVDYAFIFGLREKELRDAFNVEIQKMEADGTLKKLDQKWFSGNEAEQKMPVPPANPPKGVLRYATVPQVEPFTFLRNGQVVGYDIEVAQRIAEKLGYALEPIVVDWGGYLDAVSSGKASFGVACTTITEERKQKILFSEPDYKGSVVVMVAKTSPAKGLGIKGWFAQAGQELTASFNRTFVRENRWKLIVDGLKVTILITILSAFFGTIFAFGVCAMRRSKRNWIARIAKGYIALMQGTPILVVLMILYYIIFAKVDIHAIFVAVIGFSMNFAAYVGEMFRTGINSIPKGQMEAALALGFSKFTAFWKVILPQVLRQILPIYKGEFVSMLKMTSIVGYIAIQDLTKMSDIIRSRTYEAFFPLIITAIIYFAVAHLLAYVLTWLEFHFDPKNRRSVLKGEKNK